MSRFSIQYYVYGAFFAVLVALSGCPGPQSDPIDPTEAEMPYNPADFADICVKIRTAGGKIEAQSDGIITGVDFSGGGVTLEDALLEDALKIPGLKKIRIGPSEVSRSALNKIASQIELEELWLEGTLSEDEDLRLLANSLPKLQRVRLRRLLNVLDGGVIPFTDLKELRILAVIDMRITGDSLAAIGKMSPLNSLDVRDCYSLGITDYEQLLSMPQLEELKLGGYGVGDGILSKVGKMPKLSRLSLENAQITPEGFAKFLATDGIAGRLRGLELSKVAQIDDAALTGLEKCINLRSLVIRDIPVGGGFLHGLATAGIPLETLFLDRTLVRPDAIAVLPKFRKLKRLNLYDAYLDSELLAVISRMPALEILELPQCRLDDEMLESLTNCRKLRSLDVRGNPSITEQGYKTLEKIPSLKEVKAEREIGR